jgi:hypothetical protein
MRSLATLVIVAASTASAAPATWTGEVDYNFVDQNGFGWAAVTGKVTVTLTLDRKDGSLKVTGHRSWVDGRVAPTTPGGMDTSNKWEGDVDESYALHDLARTGDAIAFKLDPGYDHLEGHCAPTKVTAIARTTLVECTITGFQWHTIANQPELHQPIVLDSNLRAARIVNTVTGAAKPGYGTRKLAIADKSKTK